MNRAALRENTSFKTIALYGAYLLVVVLKFLLIAQNEIVAVANDSAVYVRYAHSGVTDLGSPVGYPLWLLVTSKLGFPQRTAIEVFYLLCCCMLTLVMSRRAGRTAGVVIFGALAFFPSTFHLFDNALSDSLYLCLAILAITFSLGLLFCDWKDRVRWVWLVVLGVNLGAILLTRNEDPLVVGWIVWLFACLMFRARTATAGALPIRAAAFGCCLVLVVAYSFAGLNGLFFYSTKGVWARTLATLPSHMSLLRNLSEIETGRKEVRFVPISKRARELGYLSSPTLATLRAEIERADNMYMVASAEIGLPPGEIGGGWTWHIFNDAAISHLPVPRSLRQLNEFWNKVNQEIEFSFQTGKLPKRFVLHPFLAGKLTSLVTDVPESLLLVFGKSFQAFPRLPDEGYDADIFDLICLRRISLVAPNEKQVLIQGWAASENNQQINLAQVGLEVGGSPVPQWIDLPQVARPDVDSMLTAEWKRPITAYGFRTLLKIPLQARLIARYVTDRGELVVTNELKRDLISKWPVPGRTGSLVQGIDSDGQEIIRADSKAPPDLQDRLIDMEASPVFKIILATISTLAIGSALSVIVFRRKEAVSGLAIISLFVFGVMLQRVLFYAVLNAAAWEVEPRYVSVIPVMLLVVSLPFAICTGWSRGGKLFSASQAD